MSRGIRYALAGDRDIAVWVLDFLLSQGDAPAALLSSGDERSSHANILEHRSGLPPECIARGGEFRTLEWIRRMSELNLDYIIGIHFPYRIPPEILRIPREGVLNLHPALLPYNRGWHTPSWAILDDSPVGATLHFMDEGIDTGDIVAQRALQISPGDTADALYARLKALEFALFKDEWPTLRDRRYRRAPQCRADGSTHRRQDLLQDEVQRIDLHAPTTPELLLRRLRALTTSRIEEAGFYEIDQRRFRVQVLIDEEGKASE